MTRRSEFDRTDSVVGALNRVPERQTMTPTVPDQIDDFTREDLSAQMFTLRELEDLAAHLASGGFSGTGLQRT